VREYGKVTSRIWTGQLGKAMKGDPHRQAMASYLTNCPHGNMIGLFYLPISYIQANLGWTPARIEKTLASFPADFVVFDRKRDLVLVVEAWRIELCKDDLAPEDNRRKQVVTLLRPFLGSPLVDVFFQRYPATRESVAEPLRLVPAPPPEPLRSPFEAPSEGVARVARAQEQDQEQDQEQQQEGAQGRAPRRAPPLYPPALLTAIPNLAELWQERMRCAGRKKPNASAEAKQLQHLAEVLAVHGPAPVLAAIDDSTRGGYQGIFPNKFIGGGGAGHQQRASGSRIAVTAPAADAERRRKRIRGVG